MWAGEPSIIRLVLANNPFIHPYPESESEQCVNASELFVVSVLVQNTMLFYSTKHLCWFLWNYFIYTRSSFLLYDQDCNY